MIQLNLKDTATLLGLPSPVENPVFTGISHDTRTLARENLFVAIKGERLDSHTLLDEALKKGAAAALVEQPVNSPLPQLLVQNTVTALGDIVAHWRRTFQLPLVAITGSNGKTTVKNMLASIFCSATQPEAVLATDGNLNNLIGLPLTLAQLGPNHQYAVLEMGMNQFGEIARLSTIAQPDIAVITNAASSHLKGVGDVAGVAKAKGEIFRGLNRQGTAILNADDAYVNDWLNLARPSTCLTFGLEKKADVSAIYTGRPEVSLHTPVGNITLTLSLPGRHNLMNALAATAAALAAGISAEAIQKGLATVSPAKGRLQFHQLKRRIRLIDDSYNANPFSLKAAIAVLASYPGKKMLILGDMRELGPSEIAFHTEAGKLIASAGIDLLMTYGTLSAHTTKAFGPKARHFTSQAELLHALVPSLTQDMTILVKGSRSMEMERIVKELLVLEKLPLSPEENNSCQSKLP